MVVTDQVAPPAADSGRSRSSQVPILLILGLAAALRLFMLGHENFWIDEVFQINRARTPFAFPTRFLQSLPTSLMLQLGESEFLIRLPSALFSIWDVGALYVLARHLYSERAALLASLFLALSPMHVWYAQETRWYSEWSLITVFSYLALVYILERGQLRAWLSYAALSAFNLYLFLLSIVVLACQALSAAILFLGRRFQPSRLKTAGVAILIALLVSSPVLVRILTAWRDTPTGFPRPTRLVALPYTLFTYAAGFSAGPTVRDLHFFPGVWRILGDHPEVAGYLLVFAPLLVNGLLRVIRSPSPRPEILIPWGVGLPLAVFLAALLTQGTYNVRYTFAAVPAFALILALGVERLPGRHLPRAALSLVVVGFGYSLYNYYCDPSYNKEDVRGAVTYVRDSATPDAVFLWAGRMSQPLNYYASDLETVRLLSCDPNRGQVATDPPRALRPDDPVWFAVARDWDRVGGGCLTWLLRTRVVEDSVSFAGVDLRLLLHRKKLLLELR